MCNLSEQNSNVSVNLHTLHRITPYILSLPLETQLLNLPNWALDDNGLFYVPQMCFLSARVALFAWPVLCVSSMLMSG